MISFKLSKRIEKDFFACHQRGTRKKILSPHEESNLRPSDFNTEPQRLYGEQGPLRSSKTKNIY